MDKTAKGRMKRMRERKRNENVTKGVTEPVGVTAGDVTVEMFQGKPRYLQLSDGEIFDRTYRPESNKHIPGMAACNRANDLSRGRSKAKRIAMIMMALDKETTGLDGKRVNLQTMVRYGVSGMTFQEIEQTL